MSNLIILSIITLVLAIYTFILLTRVKQTNKDGSVDIIVTAIAPVHKVHRVNHVSNKDIKKSEKNRKIRYHVA
jgi:hypothetical protein